MKDGNPVCLFLSAFVFFACIVSFSYGELTLPDQGGGQPVAVGTNSAVVDEQEPVKNKPLSLAIDLTDGSHIVGIPSIETIPLKTSFAEMQPTLKLMESIRFSEERATVVVKFQNGDKLEGSTSINEIKLNTIFGRCSIPVIHITFIDILQGGVSAIPKEGLVLYFPFDKDENGVVKDKSGSGNDGTINGAKWKSKGKIRGAYVFNGVNEFISVKNSATLTSGDLTVSAWINPEAVSSEMGMIVEKRPHDGCWELLCLGSKESESAKILLRGGSTAGVLTDVGSVPYKMWSHIVGTISGTTGKVYINGVLKKEGAVASVPATTGEVRIGSGRAWHDSDDYFKGNIDEVAIFNRALSGTEIKKIYNSGR